MKNIFVGNLSYSTSEHDLQTLFQNYGAVRGASLVTDRDTGRSWGFAFVEMPNDGEANNAIACLNGKSLDGRIVKVIEARPKDEQVFGNRSSGVRSGGGSNQNFGPLRVRQPKW